MKTTLKGSESLYRPDIILTATDLISNLNYQRLLDEDESISFDDEEIHLNINISLEEILENEALMLRIVERGEKVNVYNIIINTKSGKENKYKIIYKKEIKEE